MSFLWITTFFMGYIDFMLMLWECLMKLNWKCEDKHSISIKAPII